VHTKSRRWTINAFGYILDTARVNAQTIYSLANNLDPRKCVSVSFGWNLVKALCTPQIERRKDQVCTLKCNTTSKIYLMLGQNRVEEAVPEVSQGDRKKRRCHSCLESVYGEGYRQS